MTLLIVYGVLSICFSFLCSILEAVLLSVTPTFVNVKINEGKAYAKTLKKLKEHIDQPLITILTVNTVAPGFIETDMTKALNDDQRAATLSNVPAGRLGDPREIASAVVFLASPEAAYITGETLHVNGGMYMV